MAERRAVLHVGTHKTGTKTIQGFLADNWDAFHAAGLYIPNAGRMQLSDGLYSPGHHEIARDLNRNNVTVLDELVAELQQVPSHNILMSSEEFYPLVGTPLHLERLRDALTGLGFDIRIIIYLRDQVDFAQSLFSETMKGLNPPTFSSFLEEIIDHGARYHDGPYTIIFEYSRLIGALANIFGSSAIVARPYKDHEDSPILVSDFVRSLAATLGALRTQTLQVSSTRFNPRVSLREILSKRHAEFATDLAIDPADPTLEQPFSAMLLPEAQRIRERFAADNALVESIAGFRFSLAPLDENNVRWEMARKQRHLLARIEALHT